MEQAKQQEALDASITKSAENFMKHLSTTGAFSYLPGDRSEPEQTVSFANAMEECDSNREFLTAMFELYKFIKAPLIERDSLQPYNTGNKVLEFIQAIDVVVIECATFAAHDEHGLIE